MTTHRVEFRVPEDADSDRAGDTVVLEVDEDEHVLAAARAAGLWLPADCQKGWCTTCAARLVEGEVDQSNATRYYDTDREAGLVLPCTMKPRSDLVLVTHQQQAMLRHRADHDQPPGRAKLGDR